MLRERRLEHYQIAGAWMRLLKAVFARTYMECSKVTKASDYDCLMAAEKRIHKLCSRADDNMFREFPELGDEYTAIFYGTPDGRYRNKVDEEQTELMIQLVKDLFKDNWR